MTGGVPTAQASSVNDKPVQKDTREALLNLLRLHYNRHSLIPNDENHIFLDGGANVFAVRRGNVFILYFERPLPMFPFIFGPIGMLKINSNVVWPLLGATPRQMVNLLLGRVPGQRGIFDEHKLYNDLFAMGSLSYRPADVNFHRW
jgi:hypothetical protein